GDLGELAIVSPTKGYVVVSGLDWENPNNRVVAFNPTSGAIGATVYQTAAYLPEIATSPDHAWLAIADRNTVLLRSPRVSHTPLELETVFAHELTHLALHRRVPRGLPRWLDEGLAMLVAHELRPGDIPLLASLAATRSLTDFTGDRPSFAGTHAPRAAYAQALSMVHHLQQKGGWEGLARLLDRLAAGDGLASAAATVYGDGWHALVDGWQSAVRLRYTWLPLILSGSLVWFLASPVVGLGLVRKWRIGQRRIRAMAEEEAIAEATAELELQWDKSLRVADPPRAGETTPPEGAHDR
ncbi:MAG TPA: hypothetical protein DC005_01195, partial [Proteobacteria bacterium]|nr:hypothetical protein [Pseudomonadota bacterium]